MAGQRIVLRGSYRLPPEELEACQRLLDEITFSWEQVRGPDVVLEGADQREAAFTPTVQGDYGFRATAIFPAAARDELRESQPDTVSVTVAARFCDAPVADAGDDQLLAYEGSPVQILLDGSRSHPTVGCPELELSEYTWTVTDQPVGADVQIVPLADPAQANFTAEVTGDYLIQLQVRDSLGADGRSDIGSATVLIQLIEKTPCEDSLEVEVRAMPGDQPVAGAHVRVVDAAGSAQTADTDAAGLATLSGLAPGRRRSVTAWSDERVDALPDTGDPAQRPRYQTVTVLDHCAGRIRIPLELTASGLAARPTGIVTAKVPQSLFAQLPHSKKYAGACSTDEDCRAGYSCQATDYGDEQCTPDSLLPVFGLDDPNISGQLRGVVLLPVLPIESPSRFPVDKLLAPPPTADGFLPGNLASDDAFLNGLAAGLGLDVWGVACSSAADCPDASNYVCEADPDGTSRCRDTTALSNLRLQVPAGDQVPLVLLTTVVNVGMENLLPVLSGFLTSGSEDLEFDAGGLLGAFRLRTLHVCLLHVDVGAGQETDISARLAGLSLETCWPVTYQQQEIIEPIPDSGGSTATCQQDSDCGWPDENLRCLAADAASPDDRTCGVPLYRVRILSDQEVILQPADTGSDPGAPDFDSRLCENLPATATHEQLCAGAGDQPGSCDPPVYCDIAPPGSTECAVPYGLAVVAVDFAPGHADLPDGGRVALGFYFNVSPFSVDRTPRFLVPPLEVMGASELVGAQLYFRNIRMMMDGSYKTKPGLTMAASTARSTTRSLALPAFEPFGGLSAPPDTGLNVRITFAAEDPLADCGQVEFERVYATAHGLLPPQAGQHDLPVSLAPVGLPTGGLVGLSLSKVDRVIRQEDGSEFRYRDPLWRIFAPADATTIELPADDNPFAAGDEVWVAPVAAGFRVPFDYDLFPADLVTRRQATWVSDHYPQVAP